MRRRRDPFARCTYVPKVVRAVDCAWCGRPAIPRYPLYEIVIENDGARYNLTITGVFGSWSCAEAYHGDRIGRA